MIRIDFVSTGGEVTRVPAENGFSLMEVAKRNGIAGIVAECGGACACATCHVHVDPAWRDRTGDPAPGESDMLDFVHGRGPGSRLSCQIRITPALDGLVVHLPERQG
jgi:ferredoxin, 2Fe-2S